MQADFRLKALAEIYTIHSFAPLSNHNCNHKVCNISAIFLLLDRADERRRSLRGKVRSRSRRSGRSSPRRFASKPLAGTVQYRHGLQTCRYEEGFKLTLLLFHVISCRFAFHFHFHMCPCSFQAFPLTTCRRGGRRGVPFIACFRGRRRNNNSIV